MRSFYLLELQIDPGGARKWMQFAYPTLSQIQQALDLDLWGDLTFMNGVELLGCEERIWLRAYPASGERTEVDLRPFITLQAPTGQSFTLGTPVVSRTGGEDRRVWTLADGTVLEAEFFHSARAHVDWGAVPVAPLPAPLLGAGQFVAHPEGDLQKEDDDTDDRAGFRYGCSELETGMDDAEYRATVAEYLAVDPDWLRVNAGAVRALVDAMHATGRFDAMPVLADALQEAGCANDLFLTHCRAPACAHARGSWLVDLLRRTWANQIARTVRPDTGRCPGSPRAHS
jgi:hypothetical protein